MISRLLYHYSARLPCRLIALDSGPYLERYYLGQVLGVTLYLHRFVSSDSERHLHNHPWTAGASLILAGGYVEEIVTDLCPAAGPYGCIVERRQVRWFNRVNGNRFHRIREAAPGTWSLFGHGARALLGDGAPKGWGFLRRSPSHFYTPTDCTVYTPHTSNSPAEWWHDAPTGSQAGRVTI